jgi:hypothetical protein
MIAIDALLRDGRSALTDLQGSSPTGGFVASESRVCTRIVPGDLLRHSFDWTVAARTLHHGILGLTEIILIGQGGVIAEPKVFFSAQSAEVRTDARIDPGTLSSLVPDWPHHNWALAANTASQEGLPVPVTRQPAPRSVNSSVCADSPGTLADLQEASSAGELAIGEFRGCTWITPGDLIRSDSTWAVVACINHDGVTGRSEFTLIGPDTAISESVFVTATALAVRTDTRVDPHTLRKLIPTQTGGNTASPSSGDEAERAKAPASRTSAPALAGSSFAAPVQTGSAAAPPGPAPRRARQDPQARLQGRRR